jgi:hypothetical protein
MAYQDQLILKARGLYTYADTIGNVPEGSLSQAVNVVLDKIDIITPRRGFDTLPGTITGNVKSLHQYTTSDFTNYLLAHHNTNVLSHYDDTSDTWTAYSGTYLPPTSANVVRTVEANKNLYFTTSKGVQKLDSISAAPIDAGAPEALNMVVTSTGVNGPVESMNSVGYRALFGYKDANDNLILGAPTSKLQYDNGSGSSSFATLRIYIPTPPVAVGWFVQLYRTKNMPFSGPDPEDAGDEMQLVKEYSLSNTDITNKYTDLTDKLADELRDTALYTNATQEGDLNANYQPPQCTDATVFQNHMFFANTERKYETTFTILATDVTGGLNLDDTITLAGVTYTAKATESVASNQFALGTSGIVSQDNESTARSLVNVINNSSSNTTVWASYASTDNSIPGMVRVYERDYGDATAFTVISSAGGAFTPDLTSVKTSENEKRANRVYFSKEQQPESVPLLNYFDVGSANSPILRILPLQSILLIFKTDGIYRLTGTTQSVFQVTLMDNTTSLIASESLVAFNNTAIGFFDQGVAQVSSSSVQVVSRPIEGDLLRIRGETAATLSSLACGISYESDRKYLLCLPTDSADTINTIVYVYNTSTTSWTTYDLSKFTGIIRNKDDKLYLGAVASVSQERKDYNEFDFVDESIPTTVSVVDGTNTKLTVNNISDMVVGYIYRESDSKFSSISAIDIVNAQITVVDPLAWTVGTFEVLPYIPTTIEWNPVTAGTPQILKQFAECVLLVEKPVSDATLSFKTLMSADYEDVMLQDETIGLWGLFPWGEVPWGGEAIRSRYRTYVPRNKQKDTLIVTKLTQNTAFTPFEIAGLGFSYRTISNRASR